MAAPQEPSPPGPPGATASVPSGLSAGMTVAGKYELLRRIGSGAMGEVWAARHATLDEEVAIKLVVRGVENGDGTSAESRFLLEARVAAQLSRKTRHIVAVRDHGQDGALGYLVMELLQGESLSERMERTGPLPIAKVVPMIIQIARGLSIAHGDGVTHRDLKPSNIFVTVDEEGNALAKVLDFGIAKLRPGSRDAAFITGRGFLLGTPAYMSPEQARGKPVDHRADVWALAVITYYLLTGEFPFDAESGDALFARIIRVDPIPIHSRRPELPPIVADFFARAFAKRVEDRFQSALSLAGAFEQLEPLAGKDPLSLPPPPALAIIDEDFDRAGLTGPGLPSRRPIAWPMLAGLIVGAVLALTGVLLVVYFERDAPPLAPAALPIAPVFAGGTSSAREVPPPPPPTTTPDVLPSIAPSPAVRQAAARPVMMAQPPTPGPTLVTSEPPPVTPPAAPSPPALSPRRTDKSEIF